MHASKLAGGVLAAILTLAPFSAAVQAQPLDGKFTYQGMLKLGPAVVDDEVDLKFLLWDDPISIDPFNQIGTPWESLNVEPLLGLFTVPDIDFGVKVYDGRQFWLEIEVRFPPTTGTQRRELFLRRSARQENSTMLPSTLRCFATRVEILAAAGTREGPAGESRSSSNLGRKAMLM